MLSRFTVKSKRIEDTKLLKKNEKNKYHTVGTVPKSNRKFVEIEPT
jgi:hypothetical protein